MDNGTHTNEQPGFSEMTPASYEKSFAVQEALATLRFGIVTRKGVVVVTGVAGAGKTSLLSKLLCDLDANVHHVLIPCPVASLSEVLRLTLRNLGIAQQNESRLSMIHRLRTYLLEQYENGQIVTLVLDDAHKLTDQVLEQVIGLVLLFDAHDHGKKLLQLVLMGRRQLEKKLDGARLRPFKRHVALICHLPRSQKDEVCGDSNARPQANRSGSKDCFRPDGLPESVASSDGVPGVINDHCEAPPTSGLTEDTSKVSTPGVGNTAGKANVDGFVTSSNPHSAADVEVQAEFAENFDFSPTDQEEGDSFEEQVVSSNAVRLESSKNAGKPKPYVWASIAVAMLVLVGGIGLAASRLRWKTYMEPWRLKSGQFFETGRDYLSQLVRAQNEPGKDMIGTSHSPDAVAEEGSWTKTETADLSSEALPVVEQSTDTSDNPSSVGSFEVYDTDQNSSAIPKVVTGDRSRSALEDAEVRRRRVTVKIREGIQNRAISGIEVSLIDGIAYLDGQVATERQKQAAGRAAAMVPEVEYVENRIVVK